MCNIVLLFGPPDGPLGSLSNLHPTGFQEDGRHFKTMQHYLMYGKAKLMGDEKTAENILSAETPAEANSLAKELSYCNEEFWTIQREPILYRGLELKVQQNPPVGVLLIETQGRFLGAALGDDDIFGIGLDIDAEEAKHRSSWVGLNVLGKTWMKLREVIIHTFEI